MNKPFVVCHMLVSLDGKIDGAFMSAPECASALMEYGNIRKFYECQATLYGTVTMEESYAEGIIDELPHSNNFYSKEDYIAFTEVTDYIISVDPKGTLAWKSNYIEKKKRPKAHVIEVLTEQVSNDYLAYLRKFDISYIFAGKEQLDCVLILHKLNRLFGIQRLMIAGGGLMNWTFLQEDLIDELSLVVAPLTDGSRTTASVFEKADFLPYRRPAVFALKQVKQLSGDSLWLRYQRKQ